MSEHYSNTGQEWLTKLLELMHIPAAVKVEFKDNDPHNCWLIIEETHLSPSQIQLLIGEKGKNIDAIQYLANTALHIDPSHKKDAYFTIEIAGYRQQRQLQLQLLAEEIANQVRETGREKEIKHLSSVERRQVHSFLETAEDLITESRGQEPDRRLVVKLR